MNLDYKKLTGLKLFKNIPQNEIQNVIKYLNGYTKDFSDGDKIYNRGTKINHVGIVLKGNIILRQIQINGIEVILNIFSTYKMFGSVLCFLDEKNENLEYLSKGNTTVLFLNISSDTFYSNAYGIKILENLAEILAQISYQFYKRTKIISQQTLRDKILLFLNTYCGEIQSNPFELPLSRTEFANYINADRSALCRELSRMQKENLIKIDGKKITLNSDCS